MIAVLREYIKIRIKLVQLTGLTILMVILVLSIDDAFEVWMYNMLFLFSSFIVFRFFDDAFSVEIDRKEHPERSYLIPVKFKAFKKVTTIVIGIYLLGAGFVFPTAFLTILLLLFSSFGLYLLLSKQLLLQRLIPLLKYPVLLFCVSIISNYDGKPEVFLSSFLLMAGYDSFDAVKRNPKHIWKPVTLLFCCSILLFKPWWNYINILFCLAPLLIIYMIRYKRITSYFSILFFPITYFILTQL